MSAESSSAVILAAGLGTRMRSRTPKVLHPIGGRPMIDLLIDSLRRAGIDNVFAVVNPAQHDVLRHLDGTVELIEQREQLGSGHALAQVPAETLRQGNVIVVNGDSPLITPETLRRLVAEHEASGAAGTLAAVHDPSRNDGRVIRDPDGNLKRILEAKDASTAELERYQEINVGLYCFRGADLVAALANLRPDNAARELYLVDVFRDLAPIRVLEMSDPGEALGINDRTELARAEQVWRERKLRELMQSGVTIRDPASCFVEAGVQVGRDTVLEPFTILRGRTEIGEGCRIGPFTDIRDSSVGDRARIEHSWLEGVEFGEDSDCGPFVKLRPGTRVAAKVHIGSFAELVRTAVDSGSAIPHVSYLGDATIGKHVNIGAGTITANYDGERKNPTVIEDDCFVGVDTMLVAPRRMARGSRTGAGAVVTKDVPPDSIAVGVPARALKIRRET